MDWFWWGLLAIVLIHWVGKQRQRERIRKAYQFNPVVELGGALFAGIRELRRAGCFKRARDAIRVGFSPDGKHPIYYHGVGHLLTVSAARWGKGILLLIPVLLTWANSLICVDPNTELLAVSGSYRRRFGNVYVLDPFEMRRDMPAVFRGLRCVGFNPCADLDVNSPGFHADTDRIASACVWDEGGDGYHFSTAARMLVSGVIAALVRHGDPKKDRNLAAVARVISSGNILEFCREVVSKTKDPYIVQKLGRFATDEAKTSKEIADVIATAITQLGFISGGCGTSGGPELPAEERTADQARHLGLYLCRPQPA